jgi:hypothetical protein
MEVLLVLLGVAVVATVAALRLRRGDARQRALLVLCRRAGVEFSVIDPFEDTLFLPFRMFGRGDVRGSVNVVWDPRDDGRVRVFDYWFEERDERGAAMRQELTCAIVPLPFGVPPVAVLPRDADDVSRELAETRTIALELDGFNRRFVVRAADPRAAVAFLDQRMMDALMQLPLQVAIHVHEDRMLLVAPRLEPGSMLLLLDVARELATRVPPVVASLYPPRAAVGPFEHRWFQGRWSPDPISADADQPDLADDGPR